MHLSVNHNNYHSCYLPLFFFFIFLQSEENPLNVVSIRIRLYLFVYFCPSSIELLVCSHGWPYLNSFFFFNDPNDHRSLNVSLEYSVSTGDEEGARESQQLPGNICEWAGQHSHHPPNAALESLNLLSTGNLWPLPGYIHPFRIVRSKHNWWGGIIQGQTT